MPWYNEQCKLNKDLIRKTTKEKKQEIWGGGALEPWIRPPPRKGFGQVLCRAPPRTVLIRVFVSVSGAHIGLHSQV